MPLRSARPRGIEIDSTPATHHSIQRGINGKKIASVRGSIDRQTFLVRRRDPYEWPFVSNAGLGNPTYARRREVARANREAATGGARDANYHALDWNTADGAWDWDPIHSRRYVPVNYGTGLWP